ncbi:MAG: acyl-CoA dehydratase activase-related protein [Candidatus Pacebacteria bacterium]|nr:acyl-CoA dehydratase activase-related protein [Candidatus Paceibacterota bacterium]
MTRIKIGLPRAMLYHKYHVFWENFLNKLGFEVVVSPETNKEILKKGTTLAIDESCLSLKLYLGHTEWLLSRADHIFIPRIVSLRKNESLCTKFMGLGDIVRNTFDDVRIIEYDIDATKIDSELWNLIKVFFKFEKNIFKIISAYRYAKNEEKRHKRKELLDQLIQIENNDSKKPTVLIVSHPYTTYDALLGKPISAYLKSQDIEVIYADIAPTEKVMELSEKISHDLYWTYNKELLGGIEFYRKKIDGIVFLMVFPCGPDALVINLCQNKINDLPISVITLDELEGDAGLKTRLESFADILKIKKTKNGKK